MRHEQFPQTIAVRPVSPPIRGLVRPACAAAVVFMLLTGLAYPLVTTGVAGVIFPVQARGSVVLRDGQPVGSRLIGQNFAAPGYFHGRPSMTVAPDPRDPSATVAQPYNAALSGASNQGATSRKLVEAVAERARAYREENGLSPATLVPVDAVTASASGLDPDISLANARLQAPRVARARGLSSEAVLAVLQQHTQGRQYGVLGDIRVNVLDLNLALDLAGRAGATASAEDR